VTVFGVTQGSTFKAMFKLREILYEITVLVITGTLSATMYISNQSASNVRLLLVDTFHNLHAGPS
jgi:hypothetical protein